MTTLRQAAQMALEALKLSIPKPRPADDDYAELGWKEHNAAITALRAAFAEPEQEPDYYGLTADHLWMSISKDHYDRLKPEYRMTCYTTPPQRKPLTGEEIWALYYALPSDDFERSDRIDFARAIERAHGIGDSK